MSFSFGNMKLRSKLWLVAAVVFLGIVLIIGESLISLKGKMMDERRLKNRNVVETAYGVLDHYYKLSQSGKMTEEAAKTAATATINDLRYDKKEYFWINDLNHKLIVHPLRPESVGKDVSDLKDANGKQIYVEFVNMAKKQGEGFIDYSLKLPDKPPLPKISFIRLFTPWGWVIGSGIAVDDVNTAFWKTATTLAVTGVLVMIVMLTLVFFVSASILRQLGAEPDVVAEVVKMVAKGDLAINVETKENDNSSLMADMKEMVKRLKTIVGEIRTASESIAGGSHTLSASSEEISRGMSDQAQRASQIAASAEEMSQTTIDIAKNASSMASSATTASDIARQGEDVVAKSVKEVRAIASTVSDSSKIMRDLGDRSKQIGEIVTVINDIADQTNLLALNAAIEAARAGEQGRGFAVVADEVRKLAERTAKATSEIGSMIKGIQTDVDGAVVSMTGATKQVELGVEFSAKAGESLGRIVSSVGELHSMVQQIATATEEMSSVSEHISSDIQSIASSSKEITGGSDQIARESSGLASVAANLRGIVGKFKL